MLLSASQQAFLLDLARSAIVNALRQTPGPPPPCNDPLLLQPSGCFVTLHESRTHRLRGCIGRIQSPDALLIAVHQSAIGVLSDPRFVQNPVTLDELPNLSLEVSVLSPLVPAAHTLDFEPREHGILLAHQGRTGTFLPQVARDTGWGREQLLSRLCTEKMGLPADAWKDPAAKLLRYTAGVIGPVPFLGAPAGPSSAMGLSPHPTFAITTPSRSGLCGFSSGGNQFTT